jgi:hypothetical protein
VAAIVVRFPEEQGIRECDRLLEGRVLRDDVVWASAISSGRGDQRLPKLLVKRLVSLAASKAALVAQAVGGLEQTGCRRRGARVSGKRDCGKKRHEDMAPRAFGRKYKIQAFPECCPGLESASSSKLGEAKRVECAPSAIAITGPSRPLDRGPNDHGSSLEVAAVELELGKADCARDVVRLVSSRA